MPNKGEYISRVGETSTTNEGYKIKIIAMEGYKNCTVLFEDAKNTIVKKALYQNFRNGTIKNLNHPTKYGIGYFGEGVNKAKIDRKTTAVYNTWSDMLRRCYCNASRSKSLSYLGCSVDQRWYNFQVFAEWYKDNYIKDFQVDKDLLIKGNKIYSPETCCFVPSEINNVVIKTDSKRGDYLIGASYDKRYKRFQSRVNVGKRVSKWLGYFDTEIEAYNTYKTAKENYIKETAEKWKPLIDPRVYQALINYKVEITD